MNEDFLQYVWNYHLFNRQDLRSCQGDCIEVLETGHLNKDSGSDFFDARLKIDGLLWSGNVEVHLKASDWYAHGHNKNSAYNNVILHVVLESDKDIVLSNGRVLPCLELKIPEQYLKKYQSLMASQTWVACRTDIPKLNNFFVNHWLDRMMLERLERKADEIKKMLLHNANSLEETFYQLMSRYFGMRVNADPFEQLARSIPLKILAKHKNSLLQLEAIFYGQAGFLDDEIQNDDYYSSLQVEYRFLQRKFKLKPIEKSRWKFMRLHPLNFPTVRIAQLASLVYHSQSLFSKIIAIENVDEYYVLLQSKASQYWDTHYCFGDNACLKPKVLGKGTVDVLMINAIIPILFVYGKETNNSMFVDKALTFLEKIKPERNAIVKSWEKSGIEVKSAYRSQSLLHLKLEYCSQYRCLECELGNRVLRL